MLNFIINFLKKSHTPSGGNSGFAVPQKRDLSTEEIQALNTLLINIFFHLNKLNANAAIDEIRQQFLTGETFSTAISIGIIQSDPISYFSIDTKDTESALEFVKELCQAHRLAPLFQADHSDKSVSDVLSRFDIWLSVNGYRLVINADVDWSFEGFIIPKTQADSVMNAAKILGVGLALGCQE